MTDRQVLRAAYRSKRIEPMGEDIFFCRRCACAFSVKRLLKPKRTAVDAIVLAHVKSCDLRCGLRTSA